jgi:hypothetical protein
MAKQFRDFGVDPKTLNGRAVTAAFRRRCQGAVVCLNHARAALSEFGRGCHLFGLTKGQFSLIDLAAAVLEKTGPADVGVWTWCIAEYEVEAFTAFFVDKRVASLRVVMDWAGAQRDMPLMGELQERFGLDCLRVTKTHAKIVLVTTADGWAVTIRGSMNLNANARFEQFDVSDDAAIAGVVTDMMGELWARGKALPAGGLVHTQAAALLDATPAKWAPAPVKRWW